MVPKSHFESRWVQAPARSIPATRAVDQAVSHPRLQPSCSLVPYTRRFLPSLMVRTRSRQPPPHHLVLLYERGRADLAERNAIEVEVGVEVQIPRSSLIADTGMTTSPNAQSRQRVRVQVRRLRFLRAAPRGSTQFLYPHHALTLRPHAKEPVDMVHPWDSS